MGTDPIDVLAEPREGKSGRLPLALYALLALTAAIAVRQVTAIVAGRATDESWWWAKGPLHPGTAVAYGLYAALAAVGVAGVLCRRAWGLALLAAAWLLELGTGALSYVYLFFQGFDDPMTDRFRWLTLVGIVAAQGLWTLFIVSYLCSGGVKRAVRVGVPAEGPDAPPAPTPPPLPFPARVLAIYALAHGAITAVSFVVFVLPALRGLQGIGFLSLSTLLQWFRPAVYVLLGAAAAAAGFGVLLREAWGRYVLLGWAVLSALGGVAMWLELLRLGDLASKNWGPIGWRAACGIPIAVLTAAFLVSYLREKEVRNAVCR